MLFCLLFSGSGSFTNFLRLGSIEKGMRMLFVLLFLSLVLGCVELQNGPVPASGLVPAVPLSSQSLVLSDMSISGCERVSGSLFNPGIMHENVSVSITYGNGLSASTIFSLIAHDAKLSWSLPIVYDTDCYDSITVRVESLQDSYERLYPAPHCLDVCADGLECSSDTGWTCS